MNTPGDGGHMRIGLHLTEIDPSTAPPLALYQSPWTVSLAIAFLFRGTGAYVIDDVDNAGVERGQEDDPQYRVIRKEVMSKKGWTNLRPLSAFCPDGLLFPNLGRANYAALDRQVPLAKVARHFSTSVPALIRESSGTYGMWSLTGPDRAITATPMTAAGAALREIINRHEQAVCRSLPREQDRRSALKRLRHLMPDPEHSPGLLQYFQLCLRTGLALVGSDADVLSAARDVLPPDGGPLHHRFSDGDPTAIEIYNRAAAMQGSRPLNEQHPLPHYSVSLTDGARRDLTGPLDRSEDHIVAPKILAMEGMARMALPLNTADRSTILAREHAYRGLNSGSSQVFFDSNWLDALASCSTEVNVHELFQPLVGNHRQMPLRDLVGTIQQLQHVPGPPPSDAGGYWTHWALQETLHDLQTWHYPLLMYAIGGEEWLSELTVQSYTSYEERRATT